MGVTANCDAPTAKSVVEGGIREAWRQRSDVNRERLIARRLIVYIRKVVVTLPSKTTLTRADRTKARENLAEGPNAATTARR